jgi:hypothetical protein
MRGKTTGKLEPLMVRLPKQLSVEIQNHHSTRSKKRHASPRSFGYHRQLRIPKGMKVSAQPVTAPREGLPLIPGVFLLEKTIESLLQVSPLMISQTRNDQTRKGCIGLSFGSNLGALAGTPDAKPPPSGFEVVPFQCNLGHPRTLPLEATDRPSRGAIPDPDDAISSPGYQNSLARRETHRRGGLAVSSQFPEHFSLDLAFERKQLDCSPHSPHSQLPLLVVKGQAKDLPL